MITRDSSDWARFASGFSLSHAIHAPRPVVSLSLIFLVPQFISFLTNSAREAVSDIERFERIQRKGDSLNEMAVSLSSEERLIEERSVSIHKPSCPRDSET